MYKSQFISLDDKPGDTKCLLCDCMFVLPTNETEFLTHVFKEHRLVIADVWKIANLRRYDDQFLFCCLLYLYSSQSDTIILIISVMYITGA